MVDHREQTDKYNLAIQGIALGNAWVHPKVQFGANPDMARDHKLIPKFVTAMMDGAFEGACAHPASLCTNYEEIRAEDATWYQKATSFYEDFETYGHYCQVGLLQCQWSMYMPFMLSRKNPYDIRHNCENSKLCYDMRGIDTFFQSDRVRTRLGITNHVNGSQVTKHSWASCDTAVHLNMMFDDHLFDFSTKYLPAVEEKIRENFQVNREMRDKILCNTT
mgnify:CR=1 FL=1